MLQFSANQVLDAGHGMTKGVEGAAMVLQGNASCCGRKAGVCCRVAHANMPPALPLLPAPRSHPPGQLKYRACQHEPPNPQTHDIPSPPTTYPTTTYHSECRVPTQAPQPPDASYILPPNHLAYTHRARLSSSSPMSVLISDW